MDAVADDDHHEPYWPAQLCAGFIIACYLVLPERLTMGPTWVVPVLAGTLLAGLVITTRDRRPDDSRRLRSAALALVALVSTANAMSLALLVDALVHGGKTSGTNLLAAGGAIWLTNVAVFALWYWEVDGGGPGNRAHRREPPDLDWLFQQDTSPGLARKGWRPSLVDYLYLSFTNATAFSPTDTMPLSAHAKLLMLAQALASLVTLGLVVTRAVNILG